MNLTVQRPGSLVRSGNYCCSSIRVASMDENKNSHWKINMTHTQTTYIHRIALRAGKKWARPVEVGALASVFEKSAICYIARYTDVWNRHRKSKNTKLYEIGSGTKIFITFELKVIRHEERETHNLSMLIAVTSSALNPTNALHP